ncbi:hypothetical protein C8R43DRAFT_950812 [Mycena crocata]|nr:hypothetical protein C8R43DRAFT_950812 [Mycena crocata]
MDIWPEDKKDNQLCISQLKDGQTVKGKWYNKSTVSRHTKKDRDNRRENVLPPVQETHPMVPAPGDSEHITTVSSTAARHESESETGTSPASARRRLVFVACTLVAWLHLICGLSRDASHKVLKVLGVIIAMVTTDPLVGDHKIPMDVRTAMNRLSIEPVINRSICCPTCYRSYSLNELPQICLARETSGAKACGTPLWVERQTRAGPKIHSGLSELAIPLSFSAWHTGVNSEITPPHSEPEQDDIHLGFSIMAESGFLHFWPQ